MSRSQALRPNHGRPVGGWPGAPVVHSTTPAFRRLLGLALLAAACTLLGACGGGSDAPAAATAPVAPAGTLVGPAGGEVRAADGASLTFPAAALASAQPVSIAPDSSQSEAMSAGFERAGNRYELLPHGLTVAQPVTVRLPVEPSALGTDERWAVLKTRTDGPWELIEDVRVDGRTAVFEVRSFSWVRVIKVPASGTFVPQPEPPLPPAELSRPPRPADIPQLFGAPLPEQILLRSERATFNAKYAAVLADDGVIYLRQRDPNTGFLGDASWLPLPHPAGAAALRALSMDDQAMVAVDVDGRLASLGRDVFTLGADIVAGVLNSAPVDRMVASFVELARTGPERGLNRATADEVRDLVRWTTAWGSPLGAGPGHRLPRETLAWALSVVTQWEDGHYFDAGGVLQNIGGAGCTSLFALYDGGRRIALMDPWLPTDYSYEVGLPERGRFVAQGLSASGSTVFIIGPDGRMWTRRFDFDLSGSDVKFFPAAFDSRPAPLLSGKAAMDTLVFGKSVFKPVGPTSPAMRIILPTQEETWIAQPRISLPAGTVLYDGISIQKMVDSDGGVLPGVDRRILRVPAEQLQGDLRVTGYFERRMSANCGLPGGVCGPQTPWSDFIPFEYPGGVPPGRPLGAAALDMRAGTHSQPVSYAGADQRMGITVSEFLLNQSPARLTLTAAGASQTMRLHHFDGMRQVFGSALDQTRRGANGGREIDAQPRQMYGTLELTDSVIAGMLANPLGQVTIGLNVLMAPLAGSCPAGTVRDGLFCFPACPPNHDAFGLTCFARCPAGWRDNGLGSCDKPSYLRRAYWVWDKAACDRAGGPCEFFLGFWYPRTRPGFYCVGAACTVAACPSGMTDLGLVCTKGTRPRGTPGLSVPRMLPLVMEVSDRRLELQLDLNEGPLGPKWVLMRR
jgi:hypothetical protein